jgi:serine/threonine-protein kinase
MFKNGEKVKDLLIKKMIGKGGMGTIYFAIDTTLDREVALKEIHAHYSDNSTLMERFRIEAMTQAKMNHPNIVTVYSFINIDDKKLIVMEYVKGKSLKEMMEVKGILSVPEAITYMKQVLEALKYAHKHNIIHRDIKPGNILISEEGKIKISDFGIAKVFGAEGLTKTGMLIGTPWYTSPEQILGEGLDFRSDLYSAGVTFYEMLTGKLPFETDTNSDFQIQQAHLETPPIRPSIFNSEIGSKVEKFVLKALAKKRNKRYQNAGEMIEELEAIERNISKCTSVELDPGTEMSRISKKKSGGKRVLLFGLAFLMLIVVGFSIYYFVTLPPEEAHSNQSKSIVKKRNDPETKISSEIENTGIKDDKKEEIKELVGKESNLQTADQEILPEDRKKEISSDSNQLQQGSSSKVDKPDRIKSDELKIGKIVQEKSELKPVKIKPIAKEKPAEKQGRSSGREKVRLPVNDQISDLKDEGIQSKPDQATPEVNIEEDIFIIKSEMAKRSFSTAEEKLNKLFRIRRSARLLHLAGKIKFFQSRYNEALEFWKETINKGGEIKLQVYHRHGSQRRGCVGYLFLKENLIRYKTRTAGHSFILSRSRFLDAVKNSRGMQFSGNLGSSEKKSILSIVAQKDVERKEKFLIYFIKNHIMVNK